MSEWMNEKLLIQADKCIDKELHPNCRLLISLYSSKLLPPPFQFRFLSMQTALFGIL
jgi:hypothetical protein